MSRTADGTTDDLDPTTATLAGRAVIIVLLDSWGKYSRIGDANRIRKWLESAAAGPNG